MKYTLIGTLLLWVSVGWSAPNTTNFQAHIAKPDGTDLESNSVNFTFKYLNEAGTCTLYTETYLGVDMTGSGGDVAIQLGSGAPSFPVAGFSLEDILDNSTTNTMACVEGGNYTPTLPTEKRKFVVEFSYAGSGGTQTLPAADINSVPYAMYASDANSLGGYLANTYARFADVTTCVGGQFLTFNGTLFSCAAPGVPVNFSGALSGDVTGTQANTTVSKIQGVTVTAAAPASGEVLTFNGTAWVAAGVAGAAGGTVTSVSSANLYLSVASSSTTPVLTVNVGQVANTVAAGDDARFALAWPSSGTISGDVTGTLSATTVASVGGRTAAQVNTSVTDTLAATSLNTPSTIVKRDASGDVTLSGVSATNFSGRNFLFYDNAVNKITVKAPNVLSADYTLTLPDDDGTNGYVLSTNGAGVTSWIAASTGSVTSVGATSPIQSTGGATPNISLARASSSADGYLASNDWTTFNNKVSSPWGMTASNDIYYNGGKVGIGTVTPTEDFQVEHASGSYFRLNHNAGDPVLTIATQPWSMGGSKLNFIGILGEDEGSLDVNLSGFFVKVPHHQEIILLRDTNATNAVARSTYVDQTSSGAVANGFGNGMGFRLETTSGTARDAGALDWLWTNAGDGTHTSAMTFSTVSSGTMDERMRITGDGRVGIGKTLPGFAVDVSGDVNVTGNFKVNGTNIVSGISSVTASLPLSSSGGATPNITIATANSTTTGVITSADFSSFSSNGSKWSTNASSDIYRLSGNVGIGTATPTTEFMVVGAQGAGSTLSTAGAGARMFFYPRKSAFRAGSVTGTQWDNANVGSYSIATGWNTIASGSWSMAMGLATTASQDGSVAIGAGTKASGQYSTAMGVNTTASSTYSTAMGDWTTASGQASTAMGESTIASGDMSLAVGYLTTAESYAQTTIGAYNLPKGGETAGSWVATDPLFVVGNGTGSGSESNAMMILKNGNVGIRKTSPSYALDVSGDINLTGGSFRVGGTPITTSQWTTSSDTTSIYYNGGKVGIGTTAPSASLEILGVADFGSAPEGIRVIAADGPSDFWGAYNGGGATIKTGTGGAAIDAFAPGPNGGPLYLTTGNGGSNSDAGDGGVGGRMTLTAGDGGISSGGGDSGVGGTIELIPGAGSTPGNIILAPTRGFVGIGTSSPTHTLTVSGDLTITGTPYRASGDIAWQNPSDLRLKDIIGSYDKGLREIANVDTIIFKYKKDNPKHADSTIEYTGVIAQELRKPFPEAVKEDSDGYLSINTTSVFWAMVNAIKELFGISQEHDRAIASLKEQNDQLKQENAQIKARLERLEKAINSK